MFFVYKSIWTLPNALIIRFILKLSPFFEIGGSMKKRIIIINGTGGSGKDTFIEYTSKYCKVFNFSSIDKVKEVAKVIGWEGGKTDKDRKLLSDLKKLTTEYNDMAFESVKEAVEKFKASDDELMFIHIREPEEIERAVKAFDAETLLVRRKGYDIITTNYSDANIENYEYDYIIINTSLEDLEKEACKFVEKLKSN